MGIWIPNIQSLNSSKVIAQFLDTISKPNILVLRSRVWDVLASRIQYIRQSVQFWYVWYADPHCILFDMQLYIWTLNQFNGYLLIQLPMLNWCIQTKNIQRISEYNLMRNNPQTRSYSLIRNIYRWLSICSHVNLGQVIPPKKAVDNWCLKVTFI